MGWSCFVCPDECTLSLQWNSSSSTQLVSNQIGGVKKDQQAKAKAYLKMLQSKDMVCVMIDVLSVLRKV